MIQDSWTPEIQKEGKEDVWMRQVTPGSAPDEEKSGSCRNVSSRDVFMLCALC